MAQTVARELAVPEGNRHAGTLLEELISREEIHSRVAEIADELSRQFEGERPLFVGVLKGSFIFMADLVRSLELDVDMDFIQLASYEGALTSSGEVMVIQDLRTDVEGRHVVIIEDIIDTGLTMNFLRQRLKDARSASVTVVTLLLKEEMALLDQPLEYVGFKIPNRFVVGYGLDVDQALRGLDSIYALKEK